MNSGLHHKNGKWWLILPCAGALAGGLAWLGMTSEVDFPPRGKPPAMISAQIRVAQLADRLQPFYEQAAVVAVGRPVYDAARHEVSLVDAQIWKGAERDALKFTLQASPAPPGFNRAVIFLAFRSGSAAYKVEYFNSQDSSAPDAIAPDELRRILEHRFLGGHNALAERNGPSEWVKAVAFQRQAELIGHGASLTFQAQLNSPDVSASLQATGVQVSSDGQAIYVDGESNRHPPLTLAGQSERYLSRRFSDRMSENLEKAADQYQADPLRH